MKYKAASVQSILIYSRYFTQVQAVLVVLAVPIAYCFSYTYHSSCTYCSKSSSIPASIP